MRKTIPLKVQLEVWNRDYWTCRYCGEPVFFAPALKVLNRINPNHGYYHRNGKSGAILPLFQWRWASVDHILPVTKGGENELDNYVTACWECNLKWNDRTEGKPEPNHCNETAKNIGWDGLYGVYGFFL